MVLAGSGVMIGTNSSPNANTVVYRTVILYFQKYPGIEAASGISGEPYIFKVGAIEVSRGTLGPQGNVPLKLPVGGASGQLTIFGTTYQITLRNSIEAETTPHGVQRRLSMLGYNLGVIDGAVGEKTDRAMLNFQVDNNASASNVNGLVADATTQSKLKTVVGY
jgi:hypothetical protein